MAYDLTIYLQSYAKHMNFKHEKIKTDHTAD